MKKHISYHINSDHLVMLFLLPLHSIHIAKKNSSEGYLPLEDERNSFEWLQGIVSNTGFKSFDNKFI